MKKLSFVEFYRSEGDFYKVTENRTVESVNPFSLALQKRVFDCWQCFAGFDACTEAEYEAARAQVLVGLGLVDVCAEHDAMIAAYEVQQTNHYALFSY